MSDKVAPERCLNLAFRQQVALVLTKNERNVVAVFALTLVAMVAEIAAGTWFGSMALLADGWHMGTHAAAFCITLFAYWFARKHALNRDFSFGTGKVNYLGGFASAVALAAVALLMAVESTGRLFYPETIQYGEAIVVAIVGLAVNVASAIILHNGSHHDHHDHHDHQDHNIRAAYLHVLADTLTSVLAIVALVLGAWLGWAWLDAAIGLLGSAIIAKWALGLLRDTSAVLLDKTVPQIQPAAVKTALEQRFSVEVNDLHIWKLSENSYAVILSVTSAQKDPSVYKVALHAMVPYLSHVSVEIY